MTASQPNTIARRSRLTGRVCSAFTLIELLVVIALTVVLFTLVFVPLIDSLNLTSRAGTQIEAQSTARDVMRQLQTELSAPVYVYDNGATGTNLGDPDGRVNLWLYGGYNQGFNNNAISGSPFVVPLRYGMVEFIEPASQSEQTNSTAFDPTTGKQFPGTLTNVALPLVPGRSIARYFLGLRDNTSGVTTVKDTNGNTLSGMPVSGTGANPAYHGYANKFDDAGDVGNTDNRVTLYRAEVQPYILDPNNAGRFIPNLALFHTYTTAANGTRTKGSTPTGTLILDDPNFFYDSTLVDAAYVRNGAPGVNINGRAQIPMWECWQAVSQSRLALNKADAIALERDDRNAIVYRDATGQLDQPTGNGKAPFNPVVRPLITFTPQYVENDPGIPASLENSGAESPYTAATQYRSQYPEWSRPFRVLVYRSPDGITNPLSYIDPTTHQPLYYEMDDFEHPNSGITFQAPTATPTYVGPNVDAAGNWANSFPVNFFAFSVDNDKGVVNFAFPHTVLFHDSLNNPKPMYYNAERINNRIDPGNMEGSNVATGDPYNKRFLYLRLVDTTNTLNPTGTGAVAVSPLDQFYVDPTVNNTVCGTNILPPQYNVRIVPGSERIYGPDQTPGAHYGYRTQYTRVSANAGQVGRNQYKILYENATGAECSRDKTDPRLQTGYVEFDSLVDKDPGAGNGSANMDSTLEDPAGVIPPPQGGTPVPNYRPHSLPLLKQSGGMNVPADPVEVSYSFQMNRPSDVVKIDYMTRSIMNVNMELRLYDPRSARPQNTSLTSKIAVRNLQR